MSGIEWQTGPFDRFQVFVGWTPELRKGSRITNGKKLLSAPGWMIPEKKWQKVCSETDQSIYIGVRGLDLDLPKSAFTRQTISQIVQVELLP